MSVEHLVQMANDIGHFFASEAHADAVAGIATHIQRFWDPRMRRQIIAHLHSGGQGLDELVREAIGKVTAPPPEPATGRAAAA